MQIDKLDKEYLNIVKDIIYDEDFLKLQKCSHHGISRYDHSVKVSYAAYKYALKHHFDYDQVAIGGLLHDFFITDNLNLFGKLKSTFNHPKKAKDNALNKYDLTAKETDIIISHMFPINLRLPKYKESWLVSLYDKKVGIMEFGNKFKYQIQYSSNLILLLILNFVK
ncbi:MAG: hypothetical protein RSB71_03895 [Bacilli bacterium]